MKIIAFSHTMPALLAGRKTRTRRSWKPKYARMFKPGDRCQAYDHSPRIHGHRVAIIQIAHLPLRHFTSTMTEDDYESEGFAYMEEQGLTISGKSPRDYFEAWLLADELVYVVDFKLVRYFLTVDWCGQGHRGIFCNLKGNGFPKDGQPHTEDEMWEILGAFDLVLNPQSLLYTEEEVKEFTRWYPLGEYKEQYGYAVKPEVAECEPALP